MLFSIRGMWAAEHAGSVAVAPGPTSPTKNQTCISLHWKADSQPLEHRRNPFIFKLYLVSFLFFGHALQLEGSYFPDQAVEGQSLNHWTVREVPTDPFSMSDFQNHKIINVSFFFFFKPLSLWYLLQQQLKRSAAFPLYLQEELTVPQSIQRTAISSRFIRCNFEFHLGTGEVLNGKFYASHS